MSSYLFCNFVLLQKKQQHCNVKKSNRCLGIITRITDRTGQKNFKVVLLKLLVNYSDLNCRLTCHTKYSKYYVES